MFIKYFVENQCSRICLILIYVRKPKHMGPGVHQFVAENAKIVKGFVDYKWRMSIGFFAVSWRTFEHWIEYVKSTLSKGGLYPIEAQTSSHLFYSKMKAPSVPMTPFKQICPDWFQTGNLW